MTPLQASILCVAVGATVCQSSVFVPVRLEGADVETCAVFSCEKRCHLNQISYRGGCFCDELCLSYGDCCVDYMLHCTTNNTGVLTDDVIELVRVFDPEWGLRNASLPSHASECVEYVSASNESLLVWTETKCPLNVNDSFSTLVRKCEDVLFDYGSDIRGYAPFIADGIVYKNVFCAACHGKVNLSASVGDVSVTTVIECGDYTDVAVTLSVTNSLEELARFFIKHCTFYISAEMFTIIFDSHNHCIPVVDSCDSRLHNSLSNYADIEKNCRAYRAHVASNETGVDAIYRNPHCAFCNGVTKRHCELVAYNGIKNVPKLPTFQMLLGISHDKLKGEVLFDEKALCVAGSVYDTINKKCIQHQCPVGKVYIDTTCILYNDTTSQLKMSSASTNVYTIVTHWESEFPVSADELKRDVVESVRTYIQQLLPVSSVVARDIVTSGDSHSLSSITGITLALRSSPVPTSKRNTSLIVFVVGVYYEGPIEYKLIQFESLLRAISNTEAHSIAHLKSLYAVDIDLTNSSLHCDGNLIEESGISFTENNADRFVLLGPPSVIVNRTSMSYDTDEVPVGVRYKAGDSRGVHAVALICEAPILSCRRSSIPSNKFNIEGMTLSWLSGGQVVHKAVGSHIVLASGDVEVCSDLLASWSVSDQDDNVQGFMTLVGNILSMLCLLFTFLSHGFLKPLHTIPGKAIANLSLSLGLAQLLFQLGPFVEHWHFTCEAVSVLDHYLWLVAFAWMNVLSYDASRRFSGGLAMMSYATTPDRQLAFYLTYAWGTPLFPVISCIALQEYSDLPVYYHNVIKGTCWLGNHMTLMCAFGMPVALVICANTGFFTHAVISIRQSLASTGEVLTKREDVVVYIKLSVIMGFTWIFGFLANIEALSFMAYLFILFNTLQGVMIFVSFICTRRVLKMWRSYLMSGASFNDTDKDTNSTRSTRSTK